MTLFFYVNGAKFLNNIHDICNQMNVPNTTFRSFIEKLGNTPPAEFIGERGDLFWDPNIGSLRVSDGSTPGGISATSVGTGTTTAGISTAGLASIAYVDNKVGQATAGISTAGLASIAYVDNKVGLATAVGITTSFLAANGITFEIKDGLIIGMS